MRATAGLPTWLQQIDSMLRAHNRRGGFLVALPEYRPELAQTIATRLGLTFFDFRADILIPQGWAASRVRGGRRAASRWSNSR